MSLKPLEAFRAVAVTGSTTAAARSLDVSQSAVSRLVSQFERDAGMELFRRDRGRLVPTAEARQLLDPVTEAIESVRRVGRLADQLRLGAAGQALIRLAAPHTVAETLLPAVLKAFLAEAPDASVELMAGTYPAIERMVAAGEVDLGFVGLPVGFPGLVVERRITVANVVVLPKGHRLARRRAIGAEDLAGEPMVMIGRQQSTRLQVERVFRKAGVMPTVRIETHTVASACAMVADGLGLTLVNGLMVEGSRRLGLEIRPFRPKLHQDFGLAFAVGRPRVRLAEILGRHLGDRMESLARGRR